MKNNNLIRFVQSLVILPVVSMSLSIPPSQNTEIPQNVLAKQVNIASGTLAINQAIASKAESLIDPILNQKGQMLKAEAESIDAYFALHDMPLEGMGMTMATVAEENGLDWRLLPAIAVRESTGGKNACDKVAHNPFGWASCKVGFDSDEEAIETVAKNLGGNNPNTAKHYDNKSVKEILHAYNPPKIVPRYAEQVMAIMNAIGDADLTPTLTTTTTNTTNT